MTAQPLLKISNIGLQTMQIQDITQEKEDLKQSAFKQNVLQQQLSLYLKDFVLPDIVYKTVSYYIHVKYNYTHRIMTKSHLVF